MHDFVQVIPAKIIDQQKKESNLPRVLPEFPRISPEFLHRQFSLFLWGGGGGAQCPPAPRLLRLCTCMPLNDICLHYGGLIF